MNRLHNTPLVVLMTLVVIAGSVSALDGCVYGASRMMFALGREGYFPAAIARSHPSRKVPTLAILLTGLCMFLGIMLDVVSPNYAYVFLGSLGTIGFMWTWAMIPLSLILYRVKMGAERVAALRFKVPLYPITPVFVIAAVLLAIIAPIFQNSPGLFGLNGGEVPVVAGAIWVAVWIIYFLTIGRHFQHGHEYRAQQAAAQQAVAAGARPSSQ
jgi:L-asparagine transporter-like permease